jgi:hypothetical protein
MIIFMKCFLPETEIQPQSTPRTQKFSTGKLKLSKITDIAADAKAQSLLILKPVDEPLGFDRDYIETSGDGPFFLGKFRTV